MRYLEKKAGFSPGTIFVSVFFTAGHGSVLKVRIEELYMLFERRNHSLGSSQLSGNTTGISHRCVDWIQPN